MRLKAAIALTLSVLSGAVLAAPSVDDQRGIGVDDGAVMGVAISASYAMDKGGFAKLGLPASAAAEIDLDRVLKLNGDSDRYVYWLATSHSFVDLIAGMKAAGVDRVQLTREADPDTRLLVGTSPTVPFRSCVTAASLSLKDYSEVPYSTRYWYCTGSERAWRQSLVARRAGLDGALLVGWALTDLDGAVRGDDLLIATKVAFSKRRVGIAWLVVVQAAYAARYGEPSPAISGQLNAWVPGQECEQSRFLGVFASKAEREALTTPDESSALLDVVTTADSSRFNPC